MKSPILITGATGAMASVAVKELAKEGYPVLMACLEVEKGAKLKEYVCKEVPDARLEVLKLDLLSRKSVHELAEQLQGRTLGGIFNNAGMLSRYYGVTEDGVEQDTAVNYLNAVLLTRLLLPNIEDGGRIVSMVSLSLKFTKIDLDWFNGAEKEFSQLGNYAKSKRSLLYFSIALARRNPRLHVNVSDPGIVDTDMITMHRWFDPLADVLFRPFIHRPEKGVQPALAALRSEDSLRYYVGKHSDPIPEKYMKSPLVDQLWKRTSELLDLPIDD